MVSLAILKVVVVIVLFAVVANTAKVPARQGPFVPTSNHVGGGRHGSFASFFKGTHSRFPRSKHSVFPVNKGHFVFKPQPGSRGAPRFNPHKALSNESPGSESGRHFRSDKVTFKPTGAADKGCHGHFCEPTPPHVVEVVPSPEEPSPSPEEPSPSPESETVDCKVQLDTGDDLNYSASCICGGQTMQDVPYLFRPSENDKSIFGAFIQDTTVSAVCRTRLEDNASTSFAEVIQGIVTDNCLGPVLDNRACECD